MEIIYYAASTLDGFIADPQGGVGFLDPFGGESEDHGFSEFYGSIDSVIMGSSTYEISLTLSETWPFGDRPSWVMSRRQLEAVHSSIRMSDATPGDLVREIEAAGHTRAWLVGGGKLASSFLEQALLTECIIAVVPVVLGSGVPLFSRLEAPKTMRYVRSEEFPSGLVLLRYRFGHAEGAQA